MSFGEKNTNVVVRLLTYIWTYMSEKELDGTSFNGEISEYGGGGYTQVLPLTPNEAKDVIQYLKDNLWIDRATRAVFVDFTVYNANINLFCVVRYGGHTRSDSCP